MGGAGTNACEGHALLKAMLYIWFLDCSVCRTRYIGTNVGVLVLVEEMGMAVSSVPTVRSRFSDPDRPGPRGL